MPTFHYQALDDRGKKRKGYIEAESQSRAYNQLRDKGFTPMQLAPMGAGGAGGAYGISAGAGAATHQHRPTALARLSSLLPVGKLRLAESFHYLGIMLQTGSSLAQGLELLGRMSTGQAERVWLKIRDRVEEGEPFSQVMADYPHQFPAVYVSMIRVAEAVGRLGQVLEKVAQYEEQRSEVSGRLTTAMVYPSIILLVGAGAVYFLLSQVLPKITNIFKASKSALPDSTRMLMSLGNLLKDLGPAGLLVPLLLVVGSILAYRRVPRVKYGVDKLLWRVPLLQKSNLARFSGLLGFQIESGIPLVQAMDSSASAVTSAFFKEKILEAREEVATGKPLDRVLSKQGIFPEVYILTLSAGQKSGQLGSFLLRLTRILEHDVDNILKRIVALAEPLLILGIGLVIGFIVMAIMGPIFDLTTLVK